MKAFTAEATGLNTKNHRIPLLHEHSVYASNLRVALAKAAKQAEARWKETRPGKPMTGLLVYVVKGKLR